MKCSIRGCPGHYERRLVVHTVERGADVLVFEDVPATGVRLKRRDAAGGTHAQGIPTPEPVVAGPLNAGQSGYRASREICILKAPGGVPDCFLNAREKEYGSKTGAQRIAPAT